MSTPEEQMAAVRNSLAVAERRLKELMGKDPDLLTRSEQFELDMTIDCIRMGKQLLGDNGISKQPL